MLVRGGLFGMLALYRRPIRFGSRPPAGMPAGATVQANGVAAALGNSSTVERRTLTPLI